MKGGIYGLTKNRTHSDEYPEKHSKAEKLTLKPGRKKAMPCVVVAKAHYVGTQTISAAFLQALTLPQNKYNA